MIYVTARELLLLRMNEELLHLPRKLQILVVGYISADVPGNSSPGQLEISECCQQCTAHGRKRQLLLRRRLYHERDRTSLLMESAPDLILACNSGQTLQDMLDMDTPALSTTYNKEEAIDERAIFGALGAKFLQRYEENR